LVGRGFISADHHKPVLLASSKILWSESCLLVRKRDQSRAAIPLLIIDLSVRSIGKVNVPNCIGLMDVAVSTEVNSALPNGTSPIVRGDLDRSSAIGSHLPDTRGEESIDIAVVGHSTSDVAPVFFAELLILACLQIDLIDVVGAQSISFAANLDQHLGISPSRVVHLLPFPSSFGHTHTGTPISADGNCIALVGHSSDTVVPVPFAIGLVRSIGKVHGVKSVLVED